jgi:hypothetical protein
MRLNINSLAGNKNIFISIGALCLHFSSNGQTLTGSNLYISGTSGGSSISQNSGNDTSGININPTQTYISTNTISGGSYTVNSFIETETTGVNIGSSGTVDLFVGAVDPTTGSINGTNAISISSAYTAMYSVGSGSSTYAAWRSSTSAAITSANGLIADSTGTYLQSATDLVLTGASITLTGATNINTTGNYNTSIGNTTGIVAVVGSVVSVGTNSGSSVALGSSSGNSTISLNGNRLQNVGTGISGTDAVNLNQVNSLMSSTTSQITSLQNQANVNKAGISGVSAMTNIPSLSASQKSNFGVGIGAFQGASAIAFGGNFRIKDNLVGKISASLSSGNYVTGAGLSFGW